ncbi:tetratricopeptide repeat protein [Danxiaibacter flavus]|uniref:Tetratricopeptide repeat protein n=1 Tax=Danxiaibacter flavus TaxID=3049108 RepID=A0ABV3ZB29_9BACT|nr:tetratricopeptide repeat protein [Chitinophagaceae bacterium DXS]
MGRNLFLIILVTASALFANNISAQMAADVVNKLSSTDVINEIKKEIDVNHNYARAVELSKAAAAKYPTDMDFQFLLGRSYLLAKDYNNAETAIGNVIKKAKNYKDAYITAANIQVGKNRPDIALVFVESGLQLFPDDKDLNIKKLPLLQQGNDGVKAEQYADHLINYYRNDKDAVDAYFDYRSTIAGNFLQQKNYEQAIIQYQKILEIDPQNDAAVKQIIDAEMKTGDVEGSLKELNKGIAITPDSYEYQLKKILLLQELKRYPEALDVLQAMIKTHPNDSKLRQLNVDLRLEAGRYFRNADPYAQYQSVLDISPSNKEALNNAINYAISHRMYDDAIVWLNKALKYYSNDAALLQKKMSVLQSMQKYGEAAVIARQLWSRAPNNAAAKNMYIELTFQNARALTSELQYDSALYYYNSILIADPNNAQALNASVNILASQKNYTEALNALDKTLAFSPNNQALLLKKASVLMDDEQYEASALMLEDLIKKYPDNKKFVNAYIDANLAHARQLMQAEEIDAAEEPYAKVLDAQPNNMEALNGIINVELTQGKGKSQTALDHTNQALKYYPSSRDFLIKKAAALSALGKYNEAVAISDSLMKRYPYNAKVKDLYIEQILASAKSYRDAGNDTMALQQYRKALFTRPSDSLALVNTINLLNSGKQYDSALVVANTALQYYPSNVDFLRKRASILDSKQEYAEAIVTADSIARIKPDMYSQDYAAYLRSKTFRNQIGLMYLTSHIDSMQAANIASLQYTRYSGQNSYTARVNFAGRSVGTGLQLELESYLHHTSKWYSFINVAAANEVVFPKFRVAYSLFHNFSNGWEGEIGGRYLNLDSISTVSAVASVAKYFGDFWINLRGYGISAESNFYQAATLTARQYMNDKTTFLFAVLGFGNSPDEFTRNYQLTNNLGQTTYSIGAGFQKTFSYRNTFSINGTWYNQKINEKKYRNQYDIYLSFYRKF